MLGMSERYRRDSEATRAMMLPCISRIATALTGEYDAFVEQGDGVVLGDYGWQANTEDDGYMPDRDHLDGLRGLQWPPNRPRGSH